MKQQEQVISNFSHVKSTNNIQIPTAATVPNLIDILIVAHARGSPLPLQHFKSVSIKSVSILPTNPKYTSTTTLTFDINDLGSTITSSLSNSFNKVQTASSLILLPWKPTEIKDWVKLVIRIGTVFLQPSKYIKNINQPFFFTLFPTEDRQLYSQLMKVIPDNIFNIMDKESSITVLLQLHKQIERHITSL